MTPATLLTLVAKHSPGNVEPTIALLTDYRRTREHLTRLAQVAAVAEAQWRVHENDCTPCRLELDADDSGPICAEGLALYTRAEAFRHAVMTLKGVMTWR